ncbi:MAG TPA: ATP-grasp domain-containing protein [Terriglobales bacterium]|nr:ATP-grasp domain-containing protein [Terriglobales bacterium]
MGAARHVLLVATTTGYQAESFRRAAEALRVRITLATDRCHRLPDPWGDNAIAVRFEDPKAAIEGVKQRGPYDAILAAGDRAAVLAAGIAPALKLNFHSPESAALCHDKFAFRQVVAEAGLPAPWVKRFEAEKDDPAAAAAAVQFPCVLKPVLLSGSRGVIRANNAAEFAAAFERIRQLLARPEIQQWKDENARWILAEGYVPGIEFALEGWMAAGELRRFALFDKPDQLEGPFFEESVYLTPSRQGVEQRALIWDMVEAAARATGLGPGPIHAEIRLDGDTAYVLEVAARPIGGLCSRTLRFRRTVDGAAPSSTLASLEELLLRAALGEPLGPWQREDRAAGVMMIPIPRSGVMEEVTGIEAARRVPGIEAVEITAKPGEPLTALPEGASYLGFIFARTVTPDLAERALRDAHAHLSVHWREALPVV